MGKLKKSKKFRKSHLSTKIEHQKNVKKHTKQNSKKGGHSQLPGDAESEENGFKVPRAPDLSILEEPGFNKYLSDSEQENSSDSEGQSDDEMAAEEEAAYLAGGDVDEDDDVSAAPVDTTITKEKVASWARDIEKSAAPIKHVIRALANESLVTDVKVYDELLKISLGAVPKALRSALPLNANKMPVQGKRLTNLTGSLKLYCQSLIALLKTGRSTRIRAVLSAAQKTMPYFLSLRKLLKELVKALVNIVTNPDVEDEVKMDAFSVIRESATTYPSALLDLTLKTSYENLVRLSANTNGHTVPTINLAKNLFAHLYSIDVSTGYQTAFQQIRTLALHLKAALDKTKNPDTALNVIYTWQYVQSLDFFSRVVSMAADESSGSSLLQLIHPLVQVTLRTSTLVPSATFFPLRFYLIRSLIRLSRHTGVYIPLAPALIEVLRSSVLNKQGKKSSLKQFDFELNIRVPQNYTDSQVYQNGLADELLDLFGESFVLYSKSIAFPELSAPIIVTLKRYIKRGSNGRLNKQLQQLVERLQANADYVFKARKDVSFGPRDKEQVAAFLKDEDWEKTPLGAFVVIRRKVREERARMLAESKEQDAAAKGLDQLGSEDEVDNDDDDDSVMDEE